MFFLYLNLPTTPNWRTNNEIILRKSKSPRYFESVGGIYLGMHKDDVLRLYGQPLRVETGRWYDATWHYRGFDVLIMGEVVYKITIYSNSDRRFDWSGLSANSSKADFAYKYNTSVGRRGGLYIGHGEAIYIHNNKVTLDIFSEKSST